MRLRRHVETALERWVHKGLLDADTAQRLGDEEHRHRTEETRRDARYLLAGVGAFVLFLAAVFFVDRTWPLLSMAQQNAILLAAGAAAYALGAGLEWKGLWYPSALLLQAGGFAVLLVAELGSWNAWANATTGGVVMGILALATPMAILVSGQRGRHPATLALHTAFAFPFAATFLHRALDIDFNAILWALDGMLVLVIAALMARLAGRRDDPDDGTLAALAAALYAGLVLSLLSGLGPMEMEERALLPADVWLVLMTLLVLWGLHRAPQAFRREWYHAQLALCVILAIPMLAFTTMESLDLPAEVTGLAQAGLGAWAVRYGLRTDARGVLLAGAGALATGAWIYGVQRAAGFGAVGALVVTAALLFWVSTRIRDIAPD